MVCTFLLGLTGEDALTLICFAVFITVIHSFAILLTALRMTRRIRIKLVSWDDYWASFAAVLVAVYLGVDWWKWVSSECSNA